MTITSDICQNWDDASPRFCFETKLHIRLLISLMKDPIQGYNISKNCDDASPRFFVRLDSIWGFCDLGANSEGPVGSPTARKNKRPRPVAVLIPGYNICKICDDKCLSYFRRIFWKSLFRHFPDSLDVGFGGLTLVPYGLAGPNGDTKLLVWPLPLIYVKSAMTQVLGIWGILDRQGSLAVLLLRLYQAFPCSASQPAPRPLARQTVHSHRTHISGARALCIDPMLHHIDR